jgi:hypothetical protein
VNLEYSITLNAANKTSKTLSSKNVFTGIGKTVVLLTSAEWWGIIGLKSHWIYYERMRSEEIKKVTWWNSQKVCSEGQHRGQGMI